MKRPHIHPLEPMPAAIIKSKNKDENYIKLIKNDLDDLFQYFFGIRNWVKYRNSLTILSRFTYFSLTTLSGLQTLGEEYTNLVMINNNELKIPSFKRRLFFIILQSFGKITFDQSLNSLMEILDTPNINLWPKQLNDPRIKSKAYDIIPHIKLISNYILKFNTALFFLGSPFYSLLNRFFKINHTALRKWNGDAISIWLYKFIGYINLIQLCLMICVQYYGSFINILDFNLNKSVVSENFKDQYNYNYINSETGLNDFNEKCSLCLYKRENTTSTMCGHLFCWNCIHKWLKVKDECPICRKKVKHSRLIYLQNHD